MKKLLLSTMFLLCAVCMMADTKIIYRDAFANDATADNWTNSRGGMADEATSFVLAEDGGYMQFGNGSSSFNATRFSSFWGTTPWENVTIPEDGYTMEFWFCFNKFGNNSNSVTQRNNEIAIISATDSDDATLLRSYSGKAGETYVNYLFKLSHNPAGEAPGEGGYVGNGSCGFFINGETDEVRIAEGSWYKVVLIVKGQDVTYCIYEASGYPLVGGTRTLGEGADNRAGGLLHYQARYMGITQIGKNLQISYESSEQIANEPTVSLSAVRGNDRVYKVKFGEEETLHYMTPNGREQTINYSDCEGNVEITVTASGNLVCWTTKGSTTSSVITTSVETGWIQLADPVVEITSVSEGYGKSYKVTFDDKAAQHLLPIEYSITYTIDGGTPMEIANGGTINMPNAGTLAVTVSTLPVNGQKYYQDSQVTIANDTEYVVAMETNYLNWDDTHFTGNAAWTSSILEDSNMGHWAGHWQADHEYDLEEQRAHEADPSYVMQPTQNPVKVYRTDGSYDLPIYNLENDAEGVNYSKELLPLIPNTTRGNIAILLEEGLFVNGTSYSNLELSFDPQWITDDQAKPNFIEIRKTNSYDRYDKGPGRHTTDIVKTDATDYKLYRFETAIHSARVFVYKGFKNSSTDSDPITLEDITVTVGAGNDIYQAVANASAGKNVGNINVELVPGASYTISQTIEVPAGLTINGNGATIDASALTTPMIQMSATPTVAQNEKEAYLSDGIIVKNVTVTGLKYQFIYGNKVKALLTKVEVDNSVIGIDGTNRKSVFDFIGGGNASEILINNSTIYANPANEQNGGLFSSQSGHGSIQDLGSDKQLFAITNSTIYNIAYGKTTSSQRRNNTAGMEFKVENSVIVNSGKSGGQFIVGLNGGSANSAQTYTASNNIFNFDGADVSANEQAKVQEKIAEFNANSVAGVVTFTDAANGNFNGVLSVEGASGSSTVAVGDPRWTITIADSGSSTSEPVVYDAIVGGVLAPEFAAVAGEYGGVANNAQDGKSVITIQAGKATVTAVGGTTPANDPNIGGSAQQIVPDLGKVVDAEKHIYEVASVGAWNDISWERKSQGDIDFWYVTGTGNPYVGMNAIENSKDGEWLGTYRPDYVYYNPDGSLGMPQTGLYYKFKAEATGAFKVKVWINKGNRSTYVVNGSTMKPVSVRATGYILGQTDESGLMKNLSASEVEQVHQEKYGSDENYRYVIGYGGQQFWGWLVFDAQAGEEYTLFLSGSQIGFGGFEYYEGLTAEELVGGEGTTPEPTDPEPDPDPITVEDITVTVGAGNDIYQAVANASAGKNVGNINVELIPGASYTISQTIEVPAGFAIYTAGSFTADGNTTQTGLATIDASMLEGPLVQMSATPAVAANEQGFYPIGDCGFINVKVTGLQYQLFYANKTRYLLNMHLVYSIILMNGGSKTIFDTNGGGVIGNLDIARSTIASPTAQHTGSLYSSQSGNKATEAGLTTQSFMINRSTIYNIACQKNFMLHRQSSQTYLNYEMKNSLFVNCGKRGMTVFGMNGGQVNGNPSWYVSGNAFNFDGEDTSADEIARDTYGKIQNVVAGVMTFNDVTSGDFGGVFTYAYGTSVPNSLGDPRWTISFAEGSAPQPVVNDRMYIMEGTTLYKGKSNELAISLYNEKTVLGCQFDMVLPYGMTISDITNSDRISSHSVTYNAQGDGSIRVVVVNMDNRSFSGNDGTLLTLSLTLSSEMNAGDYFVALKNIQLTTPDYQTIRPAEQSFAIRVSDVMLGDVDSNGEINVTDVVLIIDEILGKNPENFNAVAADVDCNGEINVTDAVLVIDAILGKLVLGNQTSAAGARSVEADIVGAISLSGLNTVALNNPTAYTAFQMDVTLPMGMNLEDVILTERAKGHVVGVNQTAEGRYRVVGVSLQNNAFEGTMGDLLTLQLSGRSQGTVTIDNVVFVTPQGIQHELAGVFGEATGIGDVRGKMSDVRGDVFNLNGQRVIAPAKGLYIINGQKKVVK